MVPKRHIQAIQAQLGKGQRAEQKMLDGKVYVIRKRSYKIKKRETRRPY